MPKNYCIMQIWAESGKSALPICNYSQILYQFLTFTQNLKRSPKRSKSLLKKKMALHFICLAHLLNTIFSCITSIFISFLHFGQYSGNFTRTVSSYTFVLVFPPQIGQWIQREFFRLAFTLYTSNNGIAPR